MNVSDAYQDPRFDAEVNTHYIYFKLNVFLSNIMKRTSMKFDSSNFHVKGKRVRLHGTHYLREVIMEDMSRFLFIPIKNYSSNLPNLYLVQ